MLRHIFWYSVYNNFDLTGKHIKGDTNILPDLLSRVSIYNDLSVILAIIFVVEMVELDKEQYWPVEEVYGILCLKRLDKFTCIYVDCGKVYHIPCENLQVQYHQ